MSDRSNAWYADPVNAERRKRRMRAYGRALTELGRLYPDERIAEYRTAASNGTGKPENQALRVLRERYPRDFTRLFEEQLADAAAEVPGPDAA